MFVGNLSDQTTQSEIESLFSEVGPVVEVFLPTDRATGRMRGFAFVEFADEATMTKAVETMDGHELGGRAIRVSVAEERRPRAAPGFGGPSFGGGRGPSPEKRSKPKGSRRNLRGKKRSL